MHWSAIVACVATLGFLLAAARLAETSSLLEPCPRWTKYLIPPALLSLGALDWSLFSGMENAFHLGVWGLALLPALAIRRATLDPAAAAKARVRRLGWLGGALGALLFLTRPESVVCIASFAIFAALAVYRAEGIRAALATMLRLGVPGALSLVLQAVATAPSRANGRRTAPSPSSPSITPT